MPFTRILCPVDLSPSSRCLVRQAIAQTGGAPGARVHVLHAVEPLLLQAATMSGAPDTLRAELAADLDRLVAEASREQGVLPAFATSVAEGAPETAILDVAARDEADLIVMGMQGGALSRACFGSTLERVLRETDTPVLALPAALASQPGERPPLSTAQVIAAIDFQQPSMEAARFAAEYARTHGADFTLLHVMPAAPAWDRWRDAVAQQHEVRRARARNELDALGRELAPDRPPAIEIREGQAWDQIAASGSARPHALVVMGLGGAGRSRPRPGSVAWRVLSAGSHPVLAVPAEPHARRATRPKNRAA